MASAAYNDADIGQQKSNLRSALASVRRFACALGRAVSVAVSVALPLVVSVVGAAAVSGAMAQGSVDRSASTLTESAAASLPYSPEASSRLFDTGVRAHVQLQMLHVSAARKLLEQIYLERARATAATSQPDDDLFSAIVDASIIEGFAYSHDATLQYQDVSGVSHEHSLLPADFEPQRPDRAHSFGLDLATSERAAHSIGPSGPESDVVPHLNQDVIGLNHDLIGLNHDLISLNHDLIGLNQDVIEGYHDQELGVRPSKDTGVGASIDVMSAQSIKAHRAAAQEPKVTPQVLLGVRRDGESDHYIEQVVTVGNPGALPEDEKVSLTGPDKSGQDSLSGREHTAITTLDDERALDTERSLDTERARTALKPNNINDLSMIYGGIYGPVSFRERHLSTLSNDKRRAYNQAQALSEERRMSHYLHETMGLTGTKAAISSYLRPAARAQNSALTEKNSYYFVHSEMPSLLARRGRHYFDLTAPDGKDAQGVAVTTFAREQGTFIQYSFMYLRARYGDRNQGIFIQGTADHAAPEEHAQ